MPVRNELFGVFKILTINGGIILAEKAKHTRSMKAEAKPFIQGTSSTRILDIGNISEEFSVEAPILIGSGSELDGRMLMNTKITESLQRTGITLPMMTKANLKVSADSGCAISFTLKSDGNKANAINIFNVADAEPPAQLDTTLAGVIPTRIARNYDLAVRFGPYKYFIEECNIDVDVETKETVFLGGIDRAEDAAPTDIEAEAKAVWGKQYPFLGVAGVKVSGSGRAAVVVGSTNDPQVTDGADITEQSPGYTSTDDGNFQVMVYKATTKDTGEWVSLFVKEDGVTPLIDMSKAVITKADFDINNNIMTVGFEFICYVVAK